MYNRHCYAFCFRDECHYIFFLVWQMYIFFYLRTICASGKVSCDRVVHVQTPFGDVWSYAHSGAISGMRAIERGIMSSGVTYIYSRVIGMAMVERMSCERARLHNVPHYTAHIKDVFDKAVSMKRLRIIGRRIGVIMPTQFGHSHVT